MKILFFIGFLFICHGIQGTVTYDGKSSTHDHYCFTKLILFVYFLFIFCFNVYDPYFHVQFVVSIFLMSCNNWTFRCFMYHNYCSHCRKVMKIIIYNYVMIVILNPVQGKFSQIKWPFVIEFSVCFQIICVFIHYFICTDHLTQKTGRASEMQNPRQ